MPPRARSPLRSAPAVSPAARDLRRNSRNLTISEKCNRLDRRIGRDPGRVVWREAEHV
jgi:hypothetical protein